MDRIKEALGLGPGTFALHLDMNAVPAGGFLRGTYSCRLKKPTDIQGVLARATATRDGQVVYEQTQRCDPVAQAVEERWVLIFRIPREIALPGELLPSELTGLSWSVTVKIELGLARDPESSASFEVVGPFADGVPTEHGPVSGTSLERVVNVLAADTVSAAARVSDRMIGVHTTPQAPDYEGGLAESHRAAERAAQRAADQVRQKLQSERVDEPVSKYDTQPLDRVEVGRYDTQPLDQEPTRRRVEKPPLRLDEPIPRRAETRPLDREPTRRRVEKPPVRVEPLVREPAEPGRRRVEKPPVRVEPLVREPAEPGRRRVEKPPVRVEPVVREPAEPGRRRVEKPPVRVEPVVREPAEPGRHRIQKPPVPAESEPAEPGVEPPSEPAGASRETTGEDAQKVRRRVEKPPVQVQPSPSRLPQPDYQSSESLRWKKPGRKK
ncbi:MAG: hypothetical protein AMXMBFR33_35690 [Candidatus Xenobia bacterium]